MSNIIDLRQLEVGSYFLYTYRDSTFLGFKEGTDKCADVYQFSGTLDLISWRISDLENHDGDIIELEITPICNPLKYNLTGNRDNQDIMVDGIMHDYAEFIL